MATAVEFVHKEIDVRKKAPIKQILDANGVQFKKGKCFYQLIKPEIIQDYKLVIVRRKSDGELITGDAVRIVLEIPKSTTTSRFKFDTTSVPDFDVFVQSTSHNRVCLPDTILLYQTDDVKTSTALSPVKSTPGAASKSGGKDSVEETPKAARGTRKSARDGKRKAADVAVEEATADGENNETSSPDSAASKATKKAKSDKVEVVFSFDTTGSMYACLTEVRRGVKEAIQRLKREIPGIRIAVIAHGDYCDRASSYVTKIQQFSDNEAELCRFVQTVGSTGGGDADECYELVLQEARTKLDWSPGSTRSLVMIGDCNPHGPNYPLNTLKINWRTECQLLTEAGIRVYAVQALNRSEATAFYRSLASLTEGFHLRLDQFSSIVNFMLAICFREEGGDTLDMFEAELNVGGGGRNRELHRLFNTLQGREGVATEPGFDRGIVREDGLVPVNPSRFQVLHVGEKCSIKEFVQWNSLLFKTGRGFYEFTKPEIISAKKEVVLIDKITGDMFTGNEACHLIGAGGAGRIKPAALEKWRVFVQSTSYNRALMADTGFLYEVDTDY